MLPDKEEKDAEIEKLTSRLLQISLIATREHSYHSDLEKLAFSLDDSIILRGLLQIWLTIEQRGDFKGLPNPQIRPLGKTWEPVEGWTGGAFSSRPHSFNSPKGGSTRPVSVIGRLDPKYIKEFYRTALVAHLESAIKSAGSNKINAPRDNNNSKTDSDREVEKALDLLREYQIALRPWIEGENEPVWVGVSISSDALFWGQCVVLLPAITDHFYDRDDNDNSVQKGDIKENARADYEGVAKILIENVRRTFMPIMTIFETYVLEHRLKDNLKKEREEWLGSKKVQGLQRMRTSRQAQIATQPDNSAKDFLGLRDDWTKWAEQKVPKGKFAEEEAAEEETAAEEATEEGAAEAKTNANVLKEVGMGHPPSCVSQLNNANEKANDDHLFMSMLYHCFENVEAATGGIVETARGGTTPGSQTPINTKPSRTEVANSGGTGIGGMIVADQTSANNESAAGADSRGSIGASTATEAGQAVANKLSSAATEAADGVETRAGAVSNKEVNTSWTTHLNELERSLVSLWAARFSLVFNERPRQVPEINRFLATLKKIDDSLVFEKYLISSPAILKAIMTAVGLRHGDRGRGKASIKTALVVGGPGSGKNSMAKLVRLFSPGYRFGELITLNMASFRPKEAAVPLLLGLDIFDNSRGSSVKSFSIASLLGRAWKSQSTNMPDPPFKNGKGLAFVFDELNSLDMDTQGALLRFLESSELLALGDFEHKMENVDALIIGVMNEDPHSITKARTLDRVLRDKQVFGGMLGDYLYELFRGQRRLRDDLYFRMARGGEIVLPELRDRREDIPILFYFILTKDLMESFDKKQKKDFDIELSTYEQLMDRSLQWEGNVRELQALAREIFKLACDDHNNKQKRGEKSRLTFRGSHVHMARQNILHKSRLSSEAMA